MAYQAYDLAVSDVADVFSKIGTALVNMGWSLYDTVSATEKVYRSNGVDSNRPYGYMRFYISSTSIFFEAYLYWDTGAHTGSIKAHTSSNTISFPTGTSRLAIAGDADFVGWRNSHVADSGKYFGHIPTFFRTLSTTLTASATAGDSATVTVADSANMGAGSKFQIIGLTEGRDLLTVESITNLTHIVVVNLPRDYASGAFLGQPAQCFGATSYSTSANYFQVVALPSDVGLTEPTSSDRATFVYSMSDSYLNPDSNFGKYGLSPMLVHASDSSVIGLVDGNILKTSKGAINDLFSINDDNSESESGVYTSSSSTTISDSSKSWATNSLVGKYVSIVDGTGVLQVRKVLSNTATQLTVDAWVTQPDATSSFKISDKVYRVWDVSADFAVLEKDYSI